MNFFTFFVYVSDDNVTFFRFRWIFFQFVDVSDILITFDDFTSCSVITCPVTLVIDLTYFVVTCWYQFVCLTLELDCLWTVVYDCIVVFTYWLCQFISYRCFDRVTINVNIVYVDITLRLFQLVDICYVLIFFSNFTSCSIITCPVTLFVDLTYWVVTSWYQFVCLTLELDCAWTVVYYCIVVLINWLIFFVSDIVFNLVTIDVNIVNVYVTYFLVNIRNS